MNVLWILIGLIIVLVPIGVPIYRHMVSHESTDDAYINGRIIPISSRVSGHVAKVYIDENQKVSEGDLLLEIDPRNFQARLPWTTAWKPGRPREADRLGSRCQTLMKSLLERFGARTRTIKASATTIINYSF